MPEGLHNMTSSRKSTSQGTELGLADGQISILSELSWNRVLQSGFYSAQAGLKVFNVSGVIESYE